MQAHTSATVAGGNMGWFTRSGTDNNTDTNSNANTKQLPAGLPLLTKPLPLLPKPLPLLTKPLPLLSTSAATKQCSRMLTYAHVCARMLAYAHVCSRMLTYAHVCRRGRGRLRSVSRSLSSCGRDVWFGRPHAAQRHELERACGAACGACGCGCGCSG